MSFMYNLLMDASDIGYPVRWISFSNLGEYFAVGTSRSIRVWSVESGAPLAEDLSTNAIDPLCMTWVGRASFVVGTQNGCLYSFDIIVKDKVSGFRASAESIHHLSCNAAGTVLVSAGLKGFRVWDEARDPKTHVLHWTARSSSLTPVLNSPQKIVSVAFFLLKYRSPTLLLIIIDLDTLLAKKTFSVTGQPLSTGALSRDESSFWTVAVDGDVRIWDVHTNAITPLLKNPNTKRKPISVRFIHGQHLVLIGGHGRADILEGGSMSKLQTLWLVEEKQTFSFTGMSWQTSRKLVDNIKSPKVDILADYCNDLDKTYLIATAASREGQVVVWKAIIRQEQLSGFANFKQLFLNPPVIVALIFASSVAFWGGMAVANKP
ncbi:hypothetical protein HYPSUDRAFT_59069 [Hypholoma sublateritium FD-334 SS-4]|uniref:Anaphase-promoting complex subunit 4 WD40 domain-containing protein n=1 Tax=Hypholoma sublateritium (strain FD-334 SS-4) TaxID=945553 RepID=A0A0D2P348_HYPSF|nr:hypothetical protein HYPSUDRAFT_59069 [Hypholoma sublateritium FD-334 SS-4]